MRKLFILFLLTGSAMITKAQDVAKWAYSAKKLADGSYELHMTATVDQPWRIYSQHTPAGGPVPTKITFDKNPLVLPVGKISEVGRMEKKFEDAFGVNILFYHDQVDFVQVIKLKAAVKTAVTGSIKFMCCNDTQCLSPETIKFKIDLE